MKPPAIYVRVSTSDQTVDSQQEALLALAGPGAVVFRDQGYSGADPVRADYARLKRRLEAGEFSEIWVTRLDRLGRSLKELLEFYELADRHGVRVVVAAQGIDTSTPTGRLLRDVLGAVAEFERELIVERVQTGVDRVIDTHRRTGVWATRSGKPVGRPRLVTEEQIRRIIAERSKEPPTCWKDVAQLVGLKRSTCAAVYSKARPFLKGGPAPAEAAAH